MAKNSRRRRDNTPIANPRLPPSWPSSPRVTSPIDARQELQRLRFRELMGQTEDRRRWHPEGPRRPAASFSKPRHRLKALAPKRPVLGVPNAIGFANPTNVLVCVRRKIRKEVMHALGKAGRGGQRRPKFNFFSKVRCK